MADPLSTLVDREAPAPTNYFNPADGQNVLARYGNMRLRAQSSEDLARASGRLAQGRVMARNVAEDDIQTARRRVMETREDEEYQARKDAEASATEVLKTIDTVFDPTKPDEFDQQLAEFVKNSPASVMDDPRVSNYLKVKTAIADDNRARANAEARYKASRENALAILGYKDLMGATRAGVTPDMIDATINPQTGEPDFARVNHLRGEVERRGKAAEFDRRQSLMQQNRLALVEARDLSKKGRERRSNVEKFIIEDTAAFPSHTAKLLADTGKKDIKLLEFGENAEALRQAQEWDKNKLQKELSAAYAYQDPDDYVDFVPDLDETQRKRRQQVWEHAHKDEAFEERDAMPAVPDEIVEDYVPPKPLPQNTWEAGRRYKMADGSVKTYKGEGKWE